MSYLSCLLCPETAERVSTIEKHLREEHDIDANASGRWERVDGDPDSSPGKATFLNDFNS